MKFIHRSYYANISKFKISQNSVNSYKRWGNNKFAIEARSRGFSLQDCQQIIGGSTLVASSPSSNKYKNYSTAELCKVAASYYEGYSNIFWSTNRDAVREALSRGLKSANCKEYVRNDTKETTKKADANDSNEITLDDVDFIGKLKNLKKF